MDLYNKTRSCEGDGRFGGSLIGKDYWWYKYNDVEVETCGKCFWCVERKWAEDKNEF
jgi:7-cyano-7-deazaguanine synthase in queuosine biosynthesis